MRHDPMSRVLYMAAFALLAHAGPAPLQAQGATSQLGVLDGTVVDTAGRSLSGVQIVVLDAQRAARTGAGGGYRMESLPAGLHILRFRRVGLAPLTVPVTVVANDITGVDAVLQPMPHVLSTVVIQDSRGNIVNLPKGFAERRLTEQGTYLTSADIERLRPINTTEVLRTAPGVRVSQSGGVFNERGVTSILGNGCKYGMAVYVDGQLLSDPHLGADTTAGTDLADLVPPEEIAAVEVYRGPAEMPATLPTSPCGAVFVWTKR